METRAEINHGDSFKLPLRPHLEKGEKHDTLPVEIAQINSQWGSFREVSEEKLQAMIQDGKGNVTSDGEGENEKPSDVDTTERLDEVYKRRAEITQFAQ